MSVRSAFSVTKALQSAAGFLPQAWAGAWLVLILLFAVLAGGPWMMMHHALPSRIDCLAFVFAVLLVKLMTQGALYRIALFGKAAQSEGLGLGGIQVGRPELRLLIASLIIAAFFIMIAATVFIVFAIGLSLSGLTQGYDSSMAAVHAVFRRHSGIDIVFIVYFIAAWLFLIFVAVKFALAPAANIAERRLVTLNALGLSTGNVGKLFIGFTVILLPFILIWIAAWHHAQRMHVLSFMEAHHRTMSAMMGLHLALMALNLFVLLPLIVGFFASAYRQIADNRSK